ncbi:hypothetical protein OE88DRAFT_1419649 [Heliocybe sulcata]|uniref:F-box domain-containing protein n=1 Tax=Heliocybe sulcata TaxID=5364 RepID=A0A5C3N5K3_9AGAM|nr:hypothetical protein OE88DRAFT_1419649 [Heliocybe sulcata]
MSGSDTSKTEPTQKKLKITASNAKNTLEKWVEKKSPTKRRARAKQTAKLALLPSLPLDLLFEIFGHLLPLDLLHLARTTKPLRRILMQRSSVTVWRDALSNVEGLAPCPEDMSEPAFANLAFDLHCHGCDKKNIRNVDFRLRIRLCSGCVKKRLAQETDDMDDRVRKCLIFTDWCGNYDEECMYVREQAVAIKNELDDVPVEKWEEYIEQKQAANANIIAHAELCETWEGEVYDKRATEIDELRAARKEAIIEHLTALGWGEEIEKLPKHYDRRYPNILPLKDHFKVRDTKPLTDRTWLNMKDTMIEYMEKMKDHRLRREREWEVKENKRTAMSVYRAWRTIQELKNPNFKEEISQSIIPMIDFCELAPIKRLWEQSTEIVDPSEFEKIAEDEQEMAHELAAWRDQAREALVNRLNAALFQRLAWSPQRSLGENQASDLQLATAAFVCEGPRSIHCNLSYDESWPKPEEDKRLWYPQILNHKCNTIRLIIEVSECASTLDDPMLRVSWGDHGGYSSHARRKKWDCGRLRLDVKASKIVANIVMACGMDPRTTTVEEMDKMDARVVCLKCTYGNKCDGEHRIQVRTWRNMVAHCLKKHFGDGSIQYERITDEDAQKARDLEAAYYTNPAAPERRQLIWQCTRCRDTSDETDRCTLPHIKEHVREMCVASYVWVLKLRRLTSSLPGIARATRSRALITIALSTRLSTSLRRFR